MVRRESDDKNKLEEKYFKLLRLFHWIMYPVTAVSFLAIGMTLIRRLGTDFFLLIYFIDNWYVIAPGAFAFTLPIIRRVINKKIDKRMDKDK